MLGACSEKETEPIEDIIVEDTDTEETDSDDTDTADVIENVVPSISIISHSDDVELFEGLIERFQATVSDDDHDNTELSVAWYVDSEIVCDWTTPTVAGDSSCDIVLETGDEKIIAEVMDPNEARQFDDIYIRSGT